VAPAEKPKVVIAVYLPSGRGADAAHIAGEILANAAPRQP
jgi:cell division protein FtsI/penicillin-binding protein 2